MRMVQVATTPDERKILVCLWRFGNIRSPAALDAARGNEVTQFQPRVDLQCRIVAPPPAKKLCR